MSPHVLDMAAMGLLVSALAPLLLVGLRIALPPLEPPAPPAAGALAGFVVLHAAMTFGLLRPLDTAAPIVLLLGALVFWAPVLGSRRLPPAHRIVYLFAAMPSLDLPGVWLVARGDGPGGIAMILGMLPIGLLAVVQLWRWATAEERRAVAEPAGG
jgi:cytochrome c oxidase assembly factor CtaG